MGGGFDLSVGNFTHGRNIPLGSFLQEELPRDKTFVRNKLPQLTLFK